MKEKVPNYLAQDGCIPTDFHHPQKEDVDLRPADWDHHQPECPKSMEPGTHRVISKSTSNRNQQYSRSTESLQVLSLHCFPR